MPTLRAALLSTALLAASTATAQSPPAAPGAEAAGPQAAGPQAAGASAPSTSPASAPTVPEGGKVAPPRPARYGLGVSLGGRGWDPTLYVPIDLDRSRFELEAAFISGSVGEADASSARLGAGIFALVPTSQAMQAYSGVRLQYVHLGGTGGSSDGLRGAFVLGGEWAPAPVVALGVEWQVGYTASSGSSNVFDTTALAFLRIFLATFEPPAGASPAGEKAKPARAVKCTRNFDCVDGGICYEGVCRR